MDRNEPTSESETEFSEQDLADAFIIDDEEQDTPSKAASNDNVSDQTDLEKVEQDQIETDSEADDADAENEADKDLGADVIEPLEGMSDQDFQAYRALPVAARETVARLTSERLQVAQQQSEFARRVHDQSKAQFDELMTRMQQYDNVLAQRMQLPELPPRELMEDDPFAYQEQMDDYLRAQSEAVVAHQERQKLHAEYTERQQRQISQTQDIEYGRLQQLAPELLSQPDTMQSLVSYAERTGYSDQQMQLASAQDWVVLWKAQRFDEAQKAGAQIKKAAAPKKVAPRATRPGPAQSPNKRSRRAAEQAFEKDPSVDTLASLF